MQTTQLVETHLGAVEVLHVPGDRPPVLFFPGGHCSAAVDCGRSLVAGTGHGVVAFSRPGYGRTRVGRLTAEAFVPAVAECCRSLRLEQPAGAVGVSFGGLQAIAVAVGLPALVPRLALLSCAPSTQAFPDTRLEAMAGPVAFGPRLQRVTWAAVARSVESDAGLRRMLGSLSRRPVDDWWHTWREADRAQARVLFQTMRSDAGFVLDLRQGGADRASYRRLQQTRVGCPTLVTASRDDGSVAFAHAEDQRDTIPDATLVETDAPSHLFWLGPSQVRVAEALRGFLVSA